jgi:SsrA-binding protein
MKKETKHTIVIKNKKASRDYTFIDTYIAGIQLTGTEIKSIRAGKASLVDSYCRFRNGELYVTGMNISEYYWGNKELKKLERKIKESGLTIIMTRLFINDRGIAKAEIALARGKKEYDQRETLKRKDAQREIERKLKP